MPPTTRYNVIVIGGGHAGVEAAWAAANVLRPHGGRVALITMDPEKIGAMSCNPAIGGLAKGQMVREIDALGGLMGLAIDATGIQFRMLNQSKGPAVRGPRAQADKYRYAREVQRLLRTRDNLTILAGTVEDFIVEPTEGHAAGNGDSVDRAERQACTGVIFMPKPDVACDWRGWEQVDEKGRTLGADCCSGEFASGPGADEFDPSPTRLNADAVVLTTGTFMRGLMHTGRTRTPGGRVGEKAASGISGALQRLGFELGRLKTGTPPRLDGRTIHWDRLEIQPGDQTPVPFSDMTMPPFAEEVKTDPAYERLAERFPVLDQVPCHITHTSRQIHERILANLHRAPMYNGQIETAGPRYCPSIEDKVKRFESRDSHHVFLEPESLDTDEIYCNGISTSLPGDVQDFIVARLPGCEDAKVLRYGYAVEYDMVRPHQIDATTMTKAIDRLFLAGQINGTSGYEEAGGQGLIAGVNAARRSRNAEPIRLRRDQAYIGVMLDDLVTCTPREPYRMFTSRAEFRLQLRADNADERLTPLGRDWGCVDDLRWRVYEHHRTLESRLHEATKTTWDENGKPLRDALHRPETRVETLLDRLPEKLTREPGVRRVLAKLLADHQYAGYLKRQQREVEKLADAERRPIPDAFAFERVSGLRNEARDVLQRFRPRTLGQASRLAGITPADLMLVSVVLEKAPPSPPATSSVSDASR